MVGLWVCGRLFFQWSYSSFLNATILCSILFENDTVLSIFSFFNRILKENFKWHFAFFFHLLEKIMLILAWFKSSISSPCKCQMTKLSLLLKTGDITRGKKGNGSAWVTTGGLETNGFNHLT